jgi:hypothetical protein
MIFWPPSVLSAISTISGFIRSVADAKSARRNPPPLQAVGGPGLRVSL